MAKKSVNKNQPAAKLPSVVYVGLSNPGIKDEEYLTANQDPEGVNGLEGNDTGIMGEYELKRLVRFRTETTQFLDAVK